MEGEGGKKWSGRVKMLNPIKGYGFLESDDGDQEVFFHVASIKSTGFVSIGLGDKVEFDTKHDDKGRPVAVNITGPGGGPLQGGGDGSAESNRDRYEKGSRA